jgi:hypothetical protein
MGSPSFGLLPGNNAPGPIPGNTNPTGTNFGVGYGGTSSFNFPLLGSPSGSVTTPSSNMPLYGGTNNPLDSLSSGIWPSNPGGNQLYAELSKTYGSGTAAILAQILSAGLFNPTVASSFINAMQPSINQGEQSILNEFGDEGSRFGSAASLGLGNYLSQANLNEQQTLASMYMNAQNQEVSTLDSLLPTLHAENANKGGWLDDLVGGLEIAGGVAATALTGGAAAPILGPTIGAGLSEINAGINSTNNTGASSINPYALNSMIGAYGNPNSSIYGTYGNTGTFGLGAPSYNSPMDNNYFDMMSLLQQQQSAASSLGGGGDYGANIIDNDPSIMPFFNY